MLVEGSVITVLKDIVGLAATVRLEQRQLIVDLLDDFSPTECRIFFSDDGSLIVPKPETLFLGTDFAPP